MLSSKFLVRGVIFFGHSKKVTFFKKTEVFLTIVDFWCLLYQNFAANQNKGDQILAHFG